MGMRFQSVEKRVCLNDSNTVPESCFVKCDELVDQCEMLANVSFQKYLYALTIVRVKKIQNTVTASLST